MDHAEHVDAVAREVDAFVVAVDDGPLSAQVPTCPEWTVVDLTRHVGDFCAWWSHVLCEGNGRPKPSFTPLTDDMSAAEWVAEQGNHLLGELRSTPPDAEVWTWHETDRSAAFVARRCSHELAVHRFDAQTARGASQPIEPVLAADGIDEMVAVLTTAPRVVRKRMGQGSGETMHLHGTDEGVEAEWLVTLHPDRVDVSREHAKGDLAVRGAVSDIELLLYQRPTLQPVQRFGDESVLATWYAEFTF